MDNPNLDLMIITLREMVNTLNTEQNTLVRLINDELTRPDHVNAAKEAMKELERARSAIANARVRLTTIV